MIKKLKMIIDNPTKDILELLLTTNKTHIELQNKINFIMQDKSKLKEMDTLELLEEIDRKLELILTALKK